MKEIQEKRIESELANLKKSNVQYKSKKLNKDEYLIDVIIPENIFENENIKREISLQIQMLPNFPINAPRVFFRSPVFNL